MKDQLYIEYPNQNYIELQFSYKKHHQQSFEEVLNEYKLNNKLIANLFGSKKEKKTELKEKDQNLEFPKHEFLEEDEIENKKLFKNKLKSILENQKSFLELNQKIQNENITIEDFEKIMNFENKEIINPYFNNKSVFYKLDDNENILEVDQNKFEDFGYDDNLVLEI